MSTSLTNIATTVWNMVGPQKPTDFALDKLTNDQLIQITDNIRDIFKDSDYLDPPTLCVVGSQSSGKSITLNSILSLDILPNGKSIVTRTPIHIRLIHIKDAKVVTVEFFDNTDNQKQISSYTIDILLTSLSEHLQPIRDEINRLTEEYAGKTKNVVDKPINIRIKSPNVPNLSIVDLPGMTNIALTDQGQPEMIKDNIEQMLIKYIKNPRTIILSIIQATIDVESDMGLGLIKKYDPEFKRTIGVLTKVDMLKDSNVEKYLSGKISQNLKLGYGYFAVRNRSSDEIKTISVREAYQLEDDFFQKTEPYKSSNLKSRMGSINLGTRLSDILLTHIKTCLPSVLEEIKKAEHDIELQLDEIGRDYPNSDVEKRSVLNILIHKFQREYNSAIKDRGSYYNTGAYISKSFQKLSDDIDDLDPFTTTHFTDQIINDMIRDYNGIHMPDVMISTGLIEKCFQSRQQPQPQPQQQEQEPLTVLKEPYNICIRDVQDAMITLVDQILQKEKFARFPKLCARIKAIICGQIIPQRYEIVNEKVNDFFEEERDCIWTDDQKFRCEILPSISTKSSDSGTVNAKVRSVLSAYFTVIKNIANHSIHKKIHTFFVYRIIEDINTRLMSECVTKDIDVNQLLEENKDKAIKRDKLLKMKTKIELVKNLIVSLP